MGIGVYLNKWAFPEDESLEILSIEKPHCHGTILNNQHISDLHPSSGFCKLHRRAFGLIHGYVYSESLLLNPIDTWERIDDIRNDFNKYKNGQGTHLNEFRLLVHLKYRGEIGGSKLLLSDRKNVSKPLDCAVPTSSISENILKNQNMVFELELDGNCIRNFFYNSSEGKLVNFGKPSWIDFDS